MPPTQSSVFTLETKTTSRQVALRNIKIGDIFHAEGDNGGSLICLATSITGTVIYARTVTTQWDFKFDRRTGVGKEDKHSIQGTIDSVRRSHRTFTRR
jgi:hypothetical protein